MELYNAHFGGRLQWFAGKSPNPVKSWVWRGQSIHESITAILLNAQTKVVVFMADMDMYLRGTQEWVVSGQLWCPGPEKVQGWFFFFFSNLGLCNLSLYKNEAKISNIQTLPSYSDDTIWSQNLCRWWSYGIEFPHIHPLGSGISHDVSIASKSNY